jgi:hypothetical protein
LELLQRRGFWCKKEWEGLLFVQRDRRLDEIKIDSWREKRYFLRNGSCCHLVEKNAIIKVIADQRKVYSNRSYEKGRVIMKRKGFSNIIGKTEC